jgi:DNA mismatch repair ATPase MutL
MRLLNLKTVVVRSALALCLGMTGAQAATDTPQPAKSTKSTQSSKTSKSSTSSKAATTSKTAKTSKTSTTSKTAKTSKTSTKPKTSKTSKASAASKTSKTSKTSKSAKTAPKAVPAPPVTQNVLMLDNKFAFTLPKDYVQGPMEEIDDKARAAGVTGSLYMNKPAKRVVIITETPLPDGQNVPTNDSQTLDNIIAETLVQQQSSYKDFSKLGEKKILRNGLELRQLDISGSVEGGKVLSTTIAAVSGARTAVVNVISLEKDVSAHTAVVNEVTGSK